MIRRIISSIYLARAFNSYLENKNALARKCLDHYMSISAEKSATAIAFDGTLLIQEMNSSLAVERFHAAMEILNNKTGNDVEYVKSYCMYYLCLINKGNNCDNIRKNGIKIPASLNIKKWLPLPDIPLEL